MAELSPSLLSAYRESQKTLGEPLGFHEAIRHSHNLNTRTPSLIEPTLDEALADAAMWGDAKLMNALLAAGANPDACSAIYCDFKHASKNLGKSAGPGSLSIGGSRDRKVDHASPLACAALAGNLEAIKILLPLGGLATPATFAHPRLPHDQDWRAWSMGPFISREADALEPLSAPAIAGHVDALTTLLPAIDIQKPTHKRSVVDALACAIRLDNVDCATILSNAAGPSARFKLTRRNLDTLQLATLCGSMRCLGAFESQREDFSGLELAMLATGSGSAACLKAALRLDPKSAGATDADGCDPLMAAAESRGEGSEMVRLLLASPWVDPARANQKGLTALMLASTHVNEHIVAQLASVSDLEARAPSEDDSTALLLSAASAAQGSKSILALLAAGADPNAQTSKGASALHFLASDHAMEDVLEALCRHPKANLDIQNKAKSTPMHLALEAGQAKKCETLALAGADPRIVDGKGRSVVELARIKGAKVMNGSSVGEVAELLFGLAERLDLVDEVRKTTGERVLDGAAAPRL